MRKFIENTAADIDMILAAVVMAIVFSVSIVIVYSIIGGLDTTTIDAGLSGTPSANATDNLITNVNTFYTIGPIAIIVVAAVGIIGYIMLIRVRR